MGSVSSTVSIFREGRDLALATVWGGRHDVDPLGLLVDPLGSRYTLCWEGILQSGLAHDISVKPDLTGLALADIDGGPLLDLLLQDLPFEGCQQGCPRRVPAEATHDHANQIEETFEIKMLDTSAKGFLFEVRDQKVPAMMVM